MRTPEQVTAAIMTGVTNRFEKSVSGPVGSVWTEEIKKELEAWKKEMEAETPKPTPAARGKQRKGGK